MEIVVCNSNLTRNIIGIFQSEYSVAAINCFLGSGFHACAVAFGWQVCESAAEFDEKHQNDTDKGKKNETETDKKNCIFCRWYDTLNISYKNNVNSMVVPFDTVITGLSAILNTTEATSALQTKDAEVEINAAGQPGAGIEFRIR